MQEDPLKSGLIFAKNECVHATSIPVNRVSLDVDAFIDHHWTPQPGHHVPSISTKDEVHDKQATEAKLSGLDPNYVDNV